MFCLTWNKANQITFSTMKDSREKKTHKREKTNTSYPIKECKREKNGRNHTISTLSKTKFG